MESIIDIQRLGMRKSHALLVAATMTPDMIVEEWSKDFLSTNSAVAGLVEHGMTEFDAVRFLLFHPIALGDAKGF